MLTLQPGMDRLGHELSMSAQRDRQVRLQSVHTDIALDLPPSIQLPDGEELPYGSSTRLQIRDPDQVPYLFNAFPVDIQNSYNARGFTMDFSTGMSY